MYIGGTIIGIALVAALALLHVYGIFFIGEFLFGKILPGRSSRFVLIILKSLRRNPIRTTLTYLAAFVLVAVVTLIWSALYTLERLTAEKSKDIKIIVSERWQALSEMPFAYAAPLSQGAANPSRSTDVRPQDSMTWQMYLSTLDPVKNTRESLVFFIALDPAKILTLMDGIFDDIPLQSKQHSGPKLDRANEFRTAVEQMGRNKRGVILGRKQLEAIHKRVGDRFTVTGINFSGIDLEFEIVGVFPEGRYNDSAVMNRDYFNDALDAYPKTHGGAKHPLAAKSLSMVWLQVPDQHAFSRIAEQIDSSGLFENPQVKCETLSSAVVTNLDAYHDLILAMRWLLAPSVLSTMALIIANAISISVRERRKEIGVFKVLGFRPVQILFLVLGEAALLGALSGFLSAAIVYEAVNRLVDNTDSFLPIYIPESALWWGLVVGVFTALAGSLIPALTACRVQVAEVFARIT